jgi:hypothetical protein
MQLSRTIAATLAAALAAPIPLLHVARADAPARGFDPAARSIAVNTGLMQPLVLGGANLEVDLRLGRFIVSYSHGWSLDLGGATVVGAMRDQHVALHLPYSTGFGLGLQHYLPALRSYVDVRLEGKAHRFEAAYTSADGANRTRIADYTTFTLGGGIYWTALPFAHRRGPLGGLDISTSLRVWPRVADTLAGSQVTYANATTGRMEVHRAAAIGIADTPFLVNVSVGYAFQ